MNGIEGTMGAERAIQAILGRGHSQPPAGGALTSALQSVSRALASAGFVNITGQMRENLQVFLNDESVGVVAEEFIPESLTQLASWAADRLIVNPGEAQAAQAHVRPEAAVKLLT
jgi:hypothetical protein